MDRQTLRSLCRIFTYVDRVGCEPAIAAIEKCFAPVGALSDDEEIHRSINEFVIGGGRREKIPFIKVVRTISGMGLKEAKEWVEKYYVDRWNESTGGYEMHRV
jgi:ribosomal protein L7/L12